MVNRPVVMALSQKGKEDVLNAAMFLKRNLVTTPTTLFYSDSQSSILSANIVIYCFSDSGLTTVKTPLLRDIAITSDRGSDIVVKVHNENAAVIKDVTSLW